MSVGILHLLKICIKINLNKLNFNRLLYMYENKDIYNLILVQIFNFWHISYTVIPLGYPMC